ncbi:hypothetical protein [Flavobacterium tructae]|uniref:Uncharacterized protein n=1 Tax=Flavobacterium tructae TaxID=1114873 RepID=A0A1S1J498_9FLAO|nr:hypothetical protein [Flavobacterium tructae]OHT44441.1 hypothetical protein BHE19_12025 [Flavobacterium tructae]OXB19423.1 hypothetical protein B0A71_12850 [Flavobacterium tructae]
MIGKFVVTVWKCVADFFDRHFVALTILIGVICLTLGIYLGNDKVWFYKLLFTVGSISLTSGIFAGIAKSNQFTEIYKKILRDIIYAQEHLENRNDLEKIWDNVTQTLSNKKFQKISVTMRKNIKKYFLPLEHDYYYDNFMVDLTIDYDEEHEDYIKVKEITTFTIICDDENLKIENRYQRMLKFDPANRELSKNHSFKLTIDNVEQKIVDIRLKNVIDGNKIIESYQKDLSGKKSYVIKREDIKTYNYKYNPIRKQIAVWIYNNCTVDITYPSEMLIDIHGLGVLGEFKIEDKSNTRVKRLRAEYKGLIYKNQGFFIHFKNN